MSFWDRLKRFFGLGRAPRRRGSRGGGGGGDEGRALEAFQQHYGIRFTRPELLKLALTHRSYLSVSGQGPRESNERLEFLGDSVLGLVTSEFLYRENPGEHEGQLTKTKSLLVSKAILSRRALAMGLGRFVLMSHSEVESGGRQRLSILADAFESVVGAIYLDQGFEAARNFITQWLLQEAEEITADKRHTNYKSHLQEYVQSTYHTHPVYRIRGEVGPDHSKHFHVEVMVGKRVLGEGRGRNKKEAEQAAARHALEKIQSGRKRGRRVFDDSDEHSSRRRRTRRDRPEAPEPTATPELELVAGTAETVEPPKKEKKGATRPSRRDAIQIPPGDGADEPAMLSLPETEVREEVEPRPPAYEEDDLEEVGRPEGPLEERHIDPFGFETEEELRADEAADDDVAGDWPGPDRASGEEKPRRPTRTDSDKSPRYGRRRGRSRR